MHTLDKHRICGAALRLSFIVATWLAATACAVHAEDFCALTLNIQTAASLPPYRTWVELVDQTGHVERREQVQGSTFTMCDFGFGPHTLRVGTNECLPVSISNLRLVIGSPLRLTVFTNLCGYEDTLRNACLLYVRVTDRGGNPVPAADLSLGEPLGIHAKADSYGRIQTLFRGNQAITVTKGGFETAKTSARCRETEEVDLNIVMDAEKRPGGEQ